MTAVAKGSLFEQQYQETLIAIKTRKARVAVMGLGYVGLPLVRLFVKARFPVTGFDCDAGKVDQINNGQSYLAHIPDADIAAMLDQGRLQATTNQRSLRLAGDRHLRSHALDRAPRSGPVLYREHRPADSRPPGARPADRSGKHDLSGDAATWCCHPRRRA